MTGTLDIRTARRRYVTLCVLFWLPLGLSIAPLILLFTERGMAMAAIAGFFAVHSLTAAALELPAGGLSDALGRRAVLAAAGLLNLAALTIVALGSAPWLLGFGMALMGAGRALSSGPAEAWYVDTVQAHAGPDADLRTGLARGSSATSAALATGTLLGGALPWLLGLGPDLGARLSEATSELVLPLSVPMLLGAAVEIVFVMYVFTSLREPARPVATLRNVLRGIPATIGGGLRLGGRDALVRRVFLSAGAAGSAMAVIELLTPGRAAALSGAPELGAVLVAVLACAGFICSGVGSHLATLTACLAGSGERAVMVSLSISSGGLLMLGATAAFTGAGSMVLAAMGYGLVYLGIGAAGPNENDLLHRRVSSSGRATALSVQSLALQLAGALTGLIIGVLPPGRLPWLLGGTVLLAGAALWIHRSGTASIAAAATRQPHAVSPSPSAGGSDSHCPKTHQ
ncbi:MFS transporter permease [Streptomyces agglomeratus]|uniref:MFS transporter permease n=2 Tax=Streptomyces agglomeratus TaxID=285458 RepID=UPI0008527ACF|nr:MFS transporter permease [Streptomyces agglomeratus]OEJ37266.1 MFS transporter permease [Streptomyces agglomeratus]OEJ48355.1 MFS transporter permease [Streptomyces agglomeratus]OEJ49814.1 MFS transporter permease [Streptomyces agglomeratus]OEJ57126.1 MFS transporter permease [Streptomyces agglomeratus]